MKKGLIIICKHAVFTPDKKPIHGVASAIEQFLTKKNKDFVVIIFPLVNKYQVQIIKSIDGKVNNTSKSYKSYLPYMRYISEFLIVEEVINNLNRNVDLFIGVDPLNALWGVVLKKFKKINAVVFYTADYAKRRFPNPVLNFIYHCIDRFSVNNSDQIWNISSRITELRKHQMKTKKLNILVPNSPSFLKENTSKAHSNFYEIALVTASTVSTDIPLILDSIAELKASFPMIKLNIIGIESTMQFKRIIQNKKIQNNVNFTGQLEHEKVIENICKATIGVAIYTNKWGWNYYADSMKVREYSACGLPVIMTDVSSTAKDINDFQAGIVIENEKGAIVEAVSRLYADKKLYTKMRSNAILLAKKYNINAILNTVLKNYI